MKAGSSTSHQNETINLMTRHEVDRNVFDFNATVDDHGLDDGMDADAGIDSVHSAIDPDSDADSTSLILILSMSLMALPRIMRMRMRTTIHFSAHPNYHGGQWYDWAFVYFEVDDENGKSTAQYYP